MSRFEINLYYQLNAPYIVHETIEGETIVMNLKNGYYYSFDGIGPAIWELILKGAGLVQILRIMEDLYLASVPGVQQVAATFVEELLENKIILTDQTEAPVLSEKSVEEITSGEVFKAIAVGVPIFHRYTDMRDVLLLDPIHDVDAKGWPEPRLRHETDPMNPLTGR